jgi:nitroimidazol reductase NimA-like FMN-containing flavoprotein (pyridoxamine 5'-phosphate oxidase superfamily)
MARAVIGGNRYLVLGTAHPDGHPRVSPVFMTHHEHRWFYWVSSPGSTHSRNLVGDPRVNAVVLDSSRPASESVAVYLTGRAAVVADDDLSEQCVLAFAAVADKGGRPFAPDELSGAADLRLYLLDVATVEVHARGGHPTWGRGIDTRLEVDLSEGG